MFVPLSAVPALTGPEMAQVDRLMQTELGLDVLQLMEVAGRAVAVLARRRFLAGDPRRKRILVLAGNGGNGGDGLVAARYLHGWGATVEVWLNRPLEELSGAAAHQARILARLGLGLRPPVPDPFLPPTDLVIDALLGFGLSSAPTGPVADLIVAANAQPAPILAVDLPSGLDATSGTAPGACVRATATLTLALPKAGLLAPGNRAWVGELFLADIGVPAEAYARLGHSVGRVFAKQEILRLE